MKNLLKNIWEAPASTMAAALILAIGSATASGYELPPMLEMFLCSVAAGLAAFDGPNKGGSP